MTEKIFTGTLQTQLQGALEYLRNPMKIYNATRGGNPEVFPRVKLEDSFGEVEGKNG